MMNYKIIAVDMDGTLLNDNKLVSDYNLNMINRAVEAGVKFVIASGRVPSGLKFYEATVANNQPMICCNGAIILDHKNEIIYSNPMSKGSLLKIIDILREEKDTYYHFYDEGIIYTEQFGYAAEKFYKFNRTIDKKFRVEIRIIVDSKEFIKNTKCDISKIVVIDDDIEYLKSLRKKIDKILEVETTKSDMNNIEIMTKGTSKGNGLRLLAQHYGISVEECIAIGNDENDISMIEAAGLGVAVYNARDSIKKYANYVTEKDNNNGAIGEVIEKFILNK